MSATLRILLDECKQDLAYWERELKLTPPDKPKRIASCLAKIAGCQRLIQGIEKDMT